MDIVNTLRLIMTAKVTPADAFSAGDYKLGLSAKTVAIPGTSNIFHARSFTIPAGASRTMDLSTLQIATVDATAPVNADGVAFALTKIYAMYLELTAVSNDAVASTLAASVNFTSLTLWSGSAWEGGPIGYPALNASAPHKSAITLRSVGAGHLLFDEEGWAVGASDEIVFTEVMNAASSVTATLMIVGEQP